MSTPIVTESPRRLEPVATDPFAIPSAGLDECRHSMNYVECDLGVEVTLPRWRHARAASRHRRRSSPLDLIPRHRETLTVA